MLCSQCQQSHEYTPLVCVLTGSEPIETRCRDLEHLLQNGADPNELSWSEGRLPLYRCIREFNLRPLPILLKYGADISKKDSCGMTLLDYACRYIFGIEELIQAGANPRIGSPIGILIREYKNWIDVPDDYYFRKGMPSPAFEDVCYYLRFLILKGAVVDDLHLEPQMEWKDAKEWTSIPVDPRLKRIMFTEISCFKRHLDNPETKEIRDKLDQIHPFWRDILKEKENSLQYQALRKVLLDLKF